MKGFRGLLIALGIVITLAGACVRAQQPTAQQSAAQQSTAQQSTGQQSTGQQSTGQQSTGQQSHFQYAPHVSEGNGAPQFGAYCRTCHGNPQVERAPDPTVLKQMAPERIYAAITTGVMKEQAKDLSDVDKRAIAEYLSGRRLGGGDYGDAKLMPNHCARDSPVRDVNAVPSWNGWGADLSNTRFQPGKAAGLSAGEVSRLRLKWAFGVPGASSVYGQPTLVDGRVFFSSDSGYIYSLDAETGCVHWSFLAQAGVRSAITIGPVNAGAAKYAAYFGDVHGTVYAVDASNGELLWKVSVDKHPLSRITAAPKLYEGRLFVSVAGLEEVEAHDWRDAEGSQQNLSGGPNYPCCTFRGMVVALNADTGKQIWKTYAIQEEPKIRRKTPTSREFWGPAGGSIWNSPTVDPKRHAIYVGTGNSFTLPEVKTTDAILALDIETGKVHWSAQDTPGDVWHGGCLSSRSDRPLVDPPPPNPQQKITDNCPDQAHPDFDYSASPILTTMPDGRGILVTGQKSGVVYAHDPDNQGAVIWQNDVGRKMMGGGGEIVFGGAADHQNAYFTLHSGGLVAVQLSDGVEKWFTPMKPSAENTRHPGNTAAATVIPGVVFSAGLDGMLRALSTTDGNVLWEFNTAQEFKTVNGVKAKGGSMGAPGPTIANGMLFVTSGYIGFQNGMPGNVLLAFAPGYGY
jgi:polyvinyl alcohol dehydrogenase (cytochrome)